MSLLNRPGVYQRPVRPTRRFGGLARRDIPVFIGFTTRGPALEPVRIESLRQFAGVFEAAGQMAVDGAGQRFTPGRFQFGNRLYQFIFGELCTYPAAGAGAADGNRGTAQFARRQLAIIGGVIDRCGLIMRLCLRRVTQRTTNPIVSA